MRAKLKRGTEARQSDAIIDLLIDARPDVASLGADAANRILANVFRDVSASPNSVRTNLSGARIVLSAAFCVCAAAGMLLLRSVASVRIAAQKPTSQQFATRTNLGVRAFAQQRAEPPLIVERLRVTEWSNLSHHSSVSKRPSSSDAVRVAYQAPFNPVCSMTTFAVLTPVPSMRRIESNDKGDSTEGESLLVCIVSNDDHGATRGSTNEPNGANEVVLSPWSGRASEVMIISGFSLSCVFTEQLCAPAAPEPILVGAASVYFGNDRESRLNSFDSPCSSSRIELALPNYNTI